MNVFRAKTSVADGTAGAAAAPRSTATTSSSTTAAARGTHRASAPAASGAIAPKAPAYPTLAGPGATSATERKIVNFGDHWDSDFQNAAGLLELQLGPHRVVCKDKDGRDLGLIRNDHGQYELREVPNADVFPLVIQDSSQPFVEWGDATDVPAAAARKRPREESVDEPLAEPPPQ